MSLDKLETRFGIKIFLSEDKRHLIVYQQLDEEVVQMAMDEVDLYSIIRQLTHLHKAMPTAPLPWMTENDPDYYSTFPD